MITTELRPLRPLSKTDLDAAECHPGCDVNHPIRIAPACHPKAAVLVSYDSKDATLVVDCGACGHFITRIIVGHLQ